MILDALAELTTAVGFDLDAKRPGPGQPIKMYASGMPAATALAVTMGDDKAAAEGGLEPCVDVVVGPKGYVEFHLPSNTKRWIACTFAAGHMGVVMDGQTNE